MQLFHGKFWSCNDTSVPDVTACVGTFMLDDEVGGVVCVLIGTDTQLLLYSSLCAAAKAKSSLPQAS